MAFIGFEVPAEVGRLLSSIEVEGEREPLDHLHVTMIFLGSKIPVESIMDAAAVLHDVAEEADPFTCLIDHTDHFEPGEHSEGKYPIICPIVSPPLHKLREELAKSLGDAKVDFAKNFPDYKPHVTLSYADEAPKPQKFSPLKWEVYELILWGGDSGEDRVTVRVPLRHGHLSLKVAQRFLARR